jgi:hypothetical protein
MGIPERHLDGRRHQGLERGGLPHGDARQVERAAAPVATPLSVSAAPRRRRRRATRGRRSRAGSAARGEGPDADPPREPREAERPSRSPRPRTGSGARR